MQANDVRAPYRAGVSGDTESAPQSRKGDMQAQALQALDSLETILQRARYRLADVVVHLDTYTADLDSYQ